MRGAMAKATSDLGRGSRLVQQAILALECADLDVAEDVLDAVDDLGTDERARLRTPAKSWPA